MPTKPLSTLHARLLELAGLIADRAPPIVFQVLPHLRRIAPPIALVLRPFGIELPPLPAKLPATREGLMALIAEELNLHTPEELAVSIGGAQHALTVWLAEYDASREAAQITRPLAPIKATIPDSAEEIPADGSSGSDAAEAGAQPSPEPTPA